DRVVVEYVREQALKVLGLNPTHALGAHDGLTNFGLDSLLAIELRNRLQAGVGRPLRATLAFDYPTVDAIVRHLLRDVLGVDATAGDAQGKAPSVVPMSAPAGDAIAIVGVGCRFPGGDSPEAFWAMLRAGVDAVSEVPRSRWDLDAYYD